MNTDKILARTDRTETLSTDIREFDAYDTKGRRFGASIYFERFDYVPREDGLSWGYRIDPADLGTWYAARPHALRDRVAYGAWQSGKQFRTLEEAQAYAERYFHDAEKRALKNKKRAR